MAYDGHLCVYSLQIGHKPLLVFEKFCDPLILILYSFSPCIHNFSTSYKACYPFELFINKLSEIPFNICIYIPNLQNC